MRIHKIRICNYRQFREEEFNFIKNGKIDLHIIIGKNGHGKTNLLNAINWCLYGDEPHLSKDSQILPLLNMALIDEVQLGKSEDVKVEIWIEQYKNNYIIFERSELYQIVEVDKSVSRNGKGIKKLESKFIVKYNDAKGNTKIIEDKDETEVEVNRIVPQKIREFFFFDGERLDKYFKSATAQNIQNSIFNISQIDQLDLVSDHLEKIIQDLNREAARNNPSISETTSRVEKKEETLRGLNTQAGTVEQNIQSAKERISELNELLKGIPDIQKIEQERESAKQAIEKAEKNRNSLDEQRKRQLATLAKLTYGYGPICKTISIIEDKRLKKELPPSIDKDVLVEALENHKCNLCDRELDQNSIAHIRAIVEQIKGTSNISKQLTDIEVPIKIMQKRAFSEKKELLDIEAKKGENENVISTSETRIAEINKKISGYNADEVKNWYSERSALEGTLELNYSQRGSLKRSIEDLSFEIDKLKEQMDSERDKISKNREISNQIKLSRRAQVMVNKTKNDIMEQTRRDIEQATDKSFKKLIFKVHTFSGVEIDKNYGLHLIHSYGYDCLGSVGAAERELLALSFTLALHSISGFDAPIIIDTPVARISDEQRANFGSALANISTTKQAILLLTPAEYSEDIRENIESQIATKHEYKMSPDEKNTKLIRLV